MARAFLSLGSNLGDREASIRKATDSLAANPGVRLRKASSLYETAPIGNTDQPDFLNSVIEVETDLSPADLLHVCLDVEREMGRVRNVKWGPRVIDIDVLMYDEVLVDTPGLSIPHPRMTERAFVMAPLAEIAPDLRLPDGRTPGEALRALPDQRVRKLSEVV